MPLVLVPTPLGNLRDVTLRALDALRDCDLLVAEDSRVARKLLSAFALPGKEIWTYHEHNARTATAGIVERAREALVAVVTDAGMPGISDPGSALVAAARDAKVAVEVLPGPCAAPAALVLSGFPARRWAFEGFAPRAETARKAAFVAALATGAPSVWYESPARIRETLSDLAAVAPEGQIFLVREYTKRHEQQVRGTPRSVLDALAEPVRGEITFVLRGDEAAVKDAEVDVERRDARIDELLRAGESVSAAAKTLASEGFGERRHLYATISERKNEQRGPKAAPR